MANLNIKNRFGTNVTYSGVSKVKFDGTISGSTVTFVLPSAGSDIPDWIAGSPSSLWSAAYFNRAINWSSILSGLTYDSNHQCIVGESTHDDARTGYFYAYDATSDTAGMYILYYQDQLTGDMTPIYSTAAGTISGYDVTAGWNNTIVSLATSNSSVTFDEDILSAISDVSQIATGVSLAFGTREATVTPSTAQQVISPGTGYSALSKVTVAAMPSGTAGTPTATKSPVSNHSVTVTPSVTNTTGYITGQTKTGTAVTVSASELVSGTKSITENGTNIDVATYEKVDVNVAGLVPTGTISIGANGTYDVTEKASAEVNVPNTYTASDEGKVVSSGALVSQSSQSIATNGTYDTTLINSVTVNVSQAQPQLNAPTIAINGTTLSITNPPSNGSFVTGYKIYLDGIYQATSLTTSYNLSNIGHVAGTITVKASGTNFQDSAASTGVAYDDISWSDQSGGTLTVRGAYSTTQSGGRLIINE